MPIAPKTKRKRSTYFKSRNGCLTCRIRRVKCDETLPACRRCIDTGRACEGPSKNELTFVQPTTPSTLLTADLSPIEQPLSIFPHNAPLSEIRAFEFFLKNVVHGLGAGLDADLWTSIVPQAGLANPIIWNACLAMSTFVERELKLPDISSQLRWPFGNDPYHRQALIWYNKSLAAFSARSCQTSDTRSLALLTCVLYTSIEFQQGNVKNAEKLLEAGSKMLHRGTKAGKESDFGSRSLETSLSELLIRQPVHLVQFGYTISKEWRQVVEHPRFSLCAITSLPTARARLYPLLLRTIEYYRDDLSNADNEFWQTKRLGIQQALLYDLKNWRADFDRFLISIQTLGRAALDAYVYSCLLAYYNTAMIWTATSLTKSEMVFDEHTAMFEEILRHSELAARAMQSATPATTMPIYTFELGVSLPLYLTAWKCRHPIIRRKAAELLKQMPTRTGPHSALASAVVAELIIQLEDGGVVEQERREVAYRTMKISLENDTPVVRFPPEEHRLLHAVMDWDTMTLMYWRTTNPNTPQVLPLFGRDGGLDSCSAASR